MVYKKCKRMDLDRKKVIKKAINFDLDTKELLKHFKNTHQAYSAIKVFMEDNGFEHRQYSGYVSTGYISDASVTILTEKLNDKFKWLKDCVQKYDITEIGETYDLKYIFDEAKQKEKEKSKNKGLER